MSLNSFFYPNTPEEEGGASAPLALLAGDYMDAPKKRKAKTARSDWEQAFDLFWQDYPRKVGKPRAERAWARIKPQSQEQFDAICAGLDRWLVYWKAKDREYICHPATWLNDHRWEAEP